MGKEKGKIVVSFWGKKNNILPTVESKRGWFGAKKEIVIDAAGRTKAAIAQSLQRTQDEFLSAATTGMDDSIASAKYVNSGLGFVPLQQLEWYSAQGFIGWQICAIIAQNWLVDKAVTMPAKDAVRHGWEIEFNGADEIDPKVIDYIRKKDKDFQVKKNAIEFVRMGRTFGLRLAMFMVDSADPDFYSKPFNIDGVTTGSYKGITQIDPYWIAPELDRAAAANPAAPDFYEPTWWRINGKRVHRSHLVIFRNGDQVADILKPSYFYGGIPTPQKIYQRVYSAEKCANEAPMLLMSKRLFSLKVDTTKAITDIATFQQEIKSWSELMNNFGIKVIGGEEEVQQFDTSLVGLDETIMTQYQLVAAAANVPATKLLGTTPKGFNATGDYEETSYHEELESIQENDITPLIERHYLLLMKSHVAPKFNMQPLNTEVRWNPVNALDGPELAELNNKKADTASKLIAAGAIDGYDARQSLINDRDSGYSGLDDIVPDGPGDREHEQEMAQVALEAPATGEDSIDQGYFDPARGTLEGARIITHQRYLDHQKVVEKIMAGDYMVNVTPEFEDEGKKYRMVIDGHHSLAAALLNKVRPVFVESVPRDAVFNPVTGQATDGR